MKRTLVSAREDFPNTQVFMRMAKAGPVASVVFRNRERRPGWQYAIGHGIWMLSGLWFMASLGGSLMGMAINPWVSWLAFMGIGVVDVTWACWPYRPVRSIELDFGRDELRVLRNGKRELRRQLKVANLTVEPHPDAELEYKKMRGKIGPKQKQHCLFGYFGAAGADKVLLITRLEYPNRESLFEVAKAVKWAIEQTPSRREMEEAMRAGQGPFVPADGAGRSIKPPLD